MPRQLKSSNISSFLVLQSNNLKWELNVDTIVKKAQQLAAVLSKVEIVWFQHTVHAYLL